MESPFLHSSDPSDSPVDSTPTSWRESLTPVQRAAPLEHTIDPGFVHHGKIQTILGDEGVRVIDEMVAKLPDMPDGLKQARIDHVYTRVFLYWCELNAIRPLQDLLATESGRFFCSTERFGPCPDFYHSPRVSNMWQPPGTHDREVLIEYSTKRVVGDTLRSRLHIGDLIAIVAERKSVHPDRIVFEPLIMGFPWVVSPHDVKVDFDPSWSSREFFENYVEDFDEFAKVRDLPEPKSPDPMRAISEVTFKQCLATILGDQTHPDWGGEKSDYFSAHLHLDGRRVKGAFLLKGPARFTPMTLDHLGKKNDQIVRLSHEPADVLFLQHCHDVLSPVRETLRAFAVQPSRPRRYCVIDGRDSLRLLKAYELYDWALKSNAGAADGGT